jgi:hypothetical protein
VLTNLTDSLASGPDVIDFISGTDKIEIGHTIAAADFHSVIGVGTSNLAADLSNILNPGNLPANGAAEVSIVSGLDYGRYAVINDANPGYQAATDAVVKLTCLGSLSAPLNNTDFIA